MVVWFQCVAVYTMLLGNTILFKYIDQVASFPGPAQLSVAISTLFRTESDEKGPGNEAIDQDQELIITR